MTEWWNMTAMKRCALFSIFFSFLVYLVSAGGFDFVSFPAYYAIAFSQLMNFQDYLWIKNINKERKKNKASLLLPEQMEQVMDRLEKERSPSSIMPGSSMDGDDVCCVCGDGDVNNVNQIIYCDMCNIAVHQDCYGVPYIPEGQWLCRRCKLSPSAQVECCLCPNTSGAFKQTSDGRWAHVICAIWLNEVHFGNLVFLEPIEGVDASLERRCKLKCLVCRKKMGACLQCSTRSCLKAFHVTCAQQSGMTMKIESSLDPNNAEMMDSTELYSNDQKFIPSSTLCFQKPIIPRELGLKCNQGITLTDFTNLTFKL
ncbi:unnamed protein product [Haemonchus placei]|uniref:PHD-type domain-containing protein n=1 Tax=Haemonchus placei TaxID=6290 RepID=A0A0N4X0H7_HAEPC|nr:unnamed protein product [Haemonchus placei]